jgi:tetratricopeptide (TPR) repeat protein
MYLALIPVVALAVVVIHRRLDRAALPICLALAAGLFGITWQRNEDYHSALGLWSDTVAKSPANPWAHYNLGCELLHVPDGISEAIAEFETAIRIEPDYAEAHNNLGYALVTMPGRVNDAVAQYKEALRLKPDYAEAHSNLGNVLLKMPGRVNDAIGQYDEALRLKPDYANAYINRGLAYVKKGDFVRALADCSEAIRLKPDYANAYVNRGLAYVKKRDFVRGLADCSEAIRLQPGFAIAYSIRADCYAGNGDNEHAIANYNEAIRLQPGLADPYNNLARLWAVCSEDRIRDGRKAEEYAKKACELAEWKNPEYIDTLAVACAEAGDFNDALRWENMYLESIPPKKAADSARQRLSLFEAKKPYHENEKPN